MKVPLARGKSRPMQRTEAIMWSNVSSWLEGSRERLHVEFVPWICTMERRNCVSVASTVGFLKTLVRRAGVIFLFLLASWIADGTYVVPFCEAMMCKFR